MTERLGKRVSRSITFYPTPEDNELLETLDGLADAQQMTFSELCKDALRQFIQGGGTALTPSPYTVSFNAQDTALQQQIEAELAAQGINFSDWVKQRLQGTPPTALELRVQHLEQVVAHLQNQPLPLTRPEIEQMIERIIEQGMRQVRPPTASVPQVSVPPPPPKPAPATDPLIAELGALLLDDF